MFRLTESVDIPTLLDKISQVFPILSIDPGNPLGFLFYQGHGNEVEFGEITLTVDGLQALNSYLDRTNTLIIEEYNFWPGMPQRDRFPLMVSGYIILTLKSKNKTFHLITVPPSSTAMINDTIIRYMLPDNIEDLKNRPHAKDAIRYFIVGIHHLPEVGGTKIEH